MTKDEQRGPQPKLTYIFKLLTDLDCILLKFWYDIFLIAVLNDLKYVCRVRS